MCFASKPAMIFAAISETKTHCILKKEILMPSKSGHVLKDFGAFSRDILPVEISDRRLWQIKRNILNKLGQKKNL